MLNDFIYVAADAHLEATLRTANSEFHADGFKAFERAVDRVVERGAKAFILAGDTTNKQRVSGACIELLRTCKAKLDNAGIPGYFIPGNHDKITGWNEARIAPLEALGWINLDNSTVTMCGMTVHGMGYVPGERVRDELTRVPPCDILVMHQAFHHLLSFVDHVRKEDVPAHVRNVIVGDIHKHDLSVLPNGGIICSPGPLQPCAVDQAEHAGMLIGCFLDEAGKVQLFTDNIGCRSIQRVRVQNSLEAGSPEFNELRDRTAMNLVANMSLFAVNKWDSLRPVIQLRVEAGAEKTAALFSRAFSEDAILWTDTIPVKNAEVFEETGVFVGDADIMTLQEAVPHVADAEKPEVAELALALLNTENITQCLADWTDNALSPDTKENK